MRRALDDSDTVTGASAAEVAQVAIENPARSMPLGTLRYFGDYELLDEIARGGMGVVYKARQSSLNRIVAVKMILSGHLASAADVKRFQTEAEAAANLRHPNIVAIHEVGDHDGQHYFSMDFIEGKNLAEVARGHPMPARRAAEIVKAIAEAIHYAHQRGTLHRDLKPHNVILGANDQPHITDFGLAKQIQRDSGLTREGSIMGSPSYMSPEQAAGKQEQVGPASDVYSLGAILYELLTGRPPFREENPAATLVAVLNDSATPPSKINPRVPADLETICGKCLEKRAERRYHSARELAEELDRFLNHEPILARPISRVRQMWNWLQKHPWVITGAGTMAILALVSLSHGLWQQKQFNDWKAANPGLVAPVEFEFFFATGPLGVVWFYAA
ncbi:MAG: serine/threonine-protein kinase, partial [Verrucomicrobiota bacterium]